MALTARQTRNRIQALKDDLNHKLACIEADRQFALLEILRREREQAPLPFFRFLSPSETDAETQQQVLNPAEPLNRRQRKALKTKRRAVTQGVAR